MSTNVMLWIVAALIVVGGGGWYIASQNGAGGEGGAMMGQNEDEAGAGTFAALVARAGSWTCDVQTFIENAESQGTVFINDGMVRADFTSTINGSAVVSHMIHADGYVYTWSDAYPQGMKMRIPEGENQPSDSSAGSFDYESQVDYDCRGWMADNSKFTPPGDVTFMELGASGSGGVTIPDLPMGAQGSGNVQIPDMPLGAPVPY